MLPDHFTMVVKCASELACTIWRVKEGTWVAGDNDDLQFACCGCRQFMHNRRSSANRDAPLYDLGTLRWGRADQCACAAYDAWHPSYRSFWRHSRLSGERAELQCPKVSVHACMTMHRQ